MLRPVKSPESRYAGVSPKEEQSHMVATHQNMSTNMALKTSALAYLSSSVSQFPRIRGKDGVRPQRVARLCSRPDHPQGSQAGVGSSAGEDAFDVNLAYGHLVRSIAKAQVFDISAVLKAPLLNLNLFSQ